MEKIQAHTAQWNEETGMEDVSCCQESETMVSEVKNAIRNDKSLGYDNIPAEHIERTGMNTV